MNQIRIVIATSLVILSTAPVRAAVVSIGGAKDNTLYESPTGASSNGSGFYFFAGRTAEFTNSLRRGIIQFDVAAAVPAGSTIDSARLILHMSKSITLDHPVSLHRSLADWGEETSDALGEEGVGASAAAGDATWLHTFFNSGFWTTPGGDFAAAPSATTSVAGVGFYTWGPAAQMTADVADWYNNPASNFGWVLVGDEPAPASAKRFDAKEDTIPANRPALLVYFTSPCACPAQGDLDNSLSIDAVDLALEIDIIFFGAPDVQDLTCPRSRADFNGDGAADAVDLAALIDHIFFGGPGPTDPCSP